MPSRSQDNQNQIYWISGLMGMELRAPMDQIPVNASPLLKNISFNQPGAWLKRKGSALLGMSETGDGIYGCNEYVPNSGRSKIHAIRNQNLDEYDESSNTWSTIDTAQFAGLTKVQSMNYKNRLYWVSISDNLCYENGGTCTTVGSGGNEIRGNCIAATQNTLFVGGVTYAGGSQSYQDRVYYSLFDAANNVPDDRMYDYVATPAETMATSTRWFSCLAPVRGIYAFSATGMLYAFTDRNCYQFDLRNENNATGVQKVFDIGLANPNAIVELNGWLFWMSPDARVWVWGGAGAPTPISYSLEDDSRGDSIISKIDKSNYEEWYAGGFVNEIYLSVGDIVYYNESVRNAVLCGQFDQTMSNISWSVWNYPTKNKFYTKAILNDTISLVCGKSGINDVYKLNKTNNDGDTAISCYGRTKFIDFDNPLSTKIIKKILIKYRPQQEANTYLRLRYAIDGNFEYIDLSDPDNSITSSGIIDMYDTDSATKLDNIKIIGMPPGIRCRTFSLEVGNINKDESFEISSIGVEYSMHELDIRYGI